MKFIPKMSGTIVQKKPVENDMKQRPKEESGELSSNIFKVYPSGKGIPE